MPVGTGEDLLLPAVDHAPEADTRIRGRVGEHTHVFVDHDVARACARDGDARGEEVVQRAPDRG